MLASWRTIAKNLRMWPADLLFNACCLASGLSCLFLSVCCVCFLLSAGRFTDGFSRCFAFVVCFRCSAPAQRVVCHAWLMLIHRCAPVLRIHRQMNHCPVVVANCKAVGNTKFGPGKTVVVLFSLLSLACHA